MSLLKMLKCNDDKPIVNVMYKGSLTQNGLLKKLPVLKMYRTGSVGRSKLLIHSRFPT